jgi:host factor-I protein
LGDGLNILISRVSDSIRPGFRGTIMEHQKKKGVFSMTKPENLQDKFLNQARVGRVPVTLFLMNGFQMRGIVRGFDNFTVVLETDGKQQLIYKHAISTLVPGKSVDMNGPT